MIEEIVVGGIGYLLGGSAGRRTVVERTRLEPYCREVLEHRAPTDDSVRLLREMEEKARAQVVDAYVLRDNALSGAIVHFRSDTSMEDIYQVALDLNGEKIRFRVNLDSATWNADNCKNILLRTIADEAFRCLQVRFQ